MKIYYSCVDRAKAKVKLTLNDDGFVIEQAPYSAVFDESTGAFIEVANQYDPTLSLNVKFADIVGREDFSDHAAYNLPESPNTPKLFNFWAATKASKETGFDFAMRSGFNSAASLIIPFKNSPVSDWVLGIHVKKPSDLEVVNGTAEEHPVDAVGGLGSLREITSPSVEFLSNSETVEPNGVVSIGYKVINADGSTASTPAEIYFETTGGTLPLSRITSEGTGVLKVVAKDIEAGSTFKVKAGFKYYTGKSECKITVA